MVPSPTRRANASERATQTFKAHFTAGLASLDPDFPVSEWDRLLEQAILTLNLFYIPQESILTYQLMHISLEILTLMQLL